MTANTLFGLKSSTPCSELFGSYLGLSPTFLHEFIGLTWMNFWTVAHIYSNREECPCQRQSAFYAWVKEAHDFSSKPGSPVLKDPGGPLLNDHRDSFFLSAAANYSITFRFRFICMTKRFHVLQINEKVKCLKYLIHRKYLIIWLWDFFTLAIILQLTK